MTLNSLNKPQKILVNRKKIIGFIELNVVSDYVLESSHNNNIPNKIKRDVNDIIVPFLEATMTLISNDVSFSSSKVLNDINLVCSNYINKVLNLESEKLSIAFYYLMIVITENKMNSEGFKLMNEKGDYKIIPGATVVKNTLKDKIIPFYEKQIKYIFSKSEITENEFRNKISRDIQTRIKIALNNEKIKQRN